MKYSKRLRKELIRLKRLIVEAQVRSKILDEEIQTPRIIHRWTFLEHTNSEQMALIRYKQYVMDNILHKNEIIRRLQTVYKELTKNIEFKSRNQRIALPLEDFEAQYEELNNTLIKRTEDYLTFTHNIQVKESLCS